jgi:hypothetical protein
LKRLLVAKHFHCQRLFTIEMYLARKLTDPLRYTAYTADGSEIGANFAALLLPEDFSKTPVKSFLNTLLDSLEDFLPAFHKLNPSKLPRGQYVGEPARFLLRCAFPSLFGYCWSAEGSLAFGRNLLSWLACVLKERPSVTETFSEHWLFEGFRGFFLNLNLRSFLGPVVRPVLLDVVEADPGAVRNDPQRLLGLAQRVLDGIRANVRALPAVLNTFYREAIDFLEDRFVVYYLFYEMIVASSFANPVLAEAVDFLVPESDWKDFHFVYDVFRASSAS